MGWRAALQRLRVGRTGPIEIGALFALAFYMAAVRAFEVDPGGYAERLAYWLVCIVGGGLIGALIEPWLERIEVLAARPALRAAAIAVTMTFPVTLLVWIVTGVAQNLPADPRLYFGLLGNVFIVDCAVVAIAGLLRKALAPPRAAPGERPEPASPNPLAAKLPPRLARAPLVAVQAEDHYLRVYTLAGEALVYMKFGVALSALSTADGLQVHRSWWVARRHVEDVQFKAGRGELRLDGGIRAPVSRRFAEKVRAVDWSATTQ